MQIAQAERWSAGLVRELTVVGATNGAGIAATSAGQFRVAVIIFPVGAALLLATWIFTELRLLGQSRETRLRRLGILSAVLFVIGVADVAAGMRLGVYITDGPFEILIPCAVGVVSGMLGLGAAARRSAWSFFACVAIILVVALVAAYCAYAIMELMAELPDLWSAHFGAPSLIHVFNVMLAAGVGSYAILGLLGLALLLPEQTVWSTPQSAKPLEN